MEQGALSRHILPCSATMIGVCMTSISIVKLLENRMGQGHVDEYLALDSLVFLVSAMFSYFALRAGTRPRNMVRYEKLADLFFVGGLILMAAVATLFACETI